MSALVTDNAGEVFAARHAAMVDALTRTGRAVHDGIGLDPVAVVVHAVIPPAWVCIQVGDGRPFVEAIENVRAVETETAA